MKGSLKGIVLLIMLLSVSLSIIFGCTQSEINYKSVSSADSLYSTEMPSFVTEKWNMRNGMCFCNEEKRLFITIEPVDNVDLESYAEEHNVKCDGFVFNVIQETDTTLYYRVTRGINPWSAYELYAMKHVAEQEYIIKLSSDTFEKSEAIDIINHIQKCMKEKFCGDDRRTETKE